ncbi:hypothetical protein V6N11_082372 [Hibiscus sabdariffa]|uniref:Uncharacterized protein n=2 Tax=Hibiscus sabdariffa TaxID=183260 RepID=A0ABR2PCN9_9ROSI
MNDSQNPKKPRHQDDDPSDEGGLTALNPSPPSALLPTATRDGQQFASYRDSLMGESNGDTMQEDEPFEDDDIEILEGDEGFKLMDIENDYFLTSFRSHEDYLIVLANGPWMLFGYYLTVEPWSPDFSPPQPFPSKIVAWIRLPGLSAMLYKRSLIKEIDPVETTDMVSPAPMQSLESKEATLAHGCYLRSGNGVLSVCHNLLLLDIMRGSLWGLDSTPYRRQQGKSSAGAKQPRVMPVRKPLTIDDFSIICKVVPKASSSRTTLGKSGSIVLEKSRHSAMVISKNSNPNCPTMDVDLGLLFACPNSLTPGNCLILVQAYQLARIWLCCKLYKMSQLLKGLCQLQRKSLTCLIDRWRAISNGFSEFLHNIAWSIGNGNSIDIFNDTWVPSLGLLRDHTEDPSLLSCGVSLKDFVVENGTWDCNALRDLFPTSAYSRLDGSLWTPKQEIWPTIWRMNIPQHIRLFMWIAYQRKLLRNVELCRRNMLATPNCVGIALLQPYENFVASDLEFTVESFVCVISLLNRSITGDSHYHGCVTASNLLPIAPRLGTQAWTPLSSGWVCLTIDGGVSLSSVKGRIRGLIRNTEGDWMVGSVKSIGFSNSLQAELWVVFEGMKLAWEFGFKRLLVQSDCRQAVGLVNDASSDSSVLSLVRAIARLRQK